LIGTDVKQFRTPPVHGPGVEKHWKSWICTRMAAD